MSKLTELKVVGVRYNETRRGLAYEAKTNVKGVSIWNDGNGGGTYVDYNKDTKDFKLLNAYKDLYGGIGADRKLEALIDAYEYKGLGMVSIGDNKYQINADYPLQDTLVIDGFATFQWDARTEKYVNQDGVLIFVK